MKEGDYSSREPKIIFLRSIDLLKIADAEDFANKQSQKFSVTFTNETADTRLRSSLPSTKKNVSFNDSQNYTLNVSAGTLDDNNESSLSSRPILKSSTTVTAAPSRNDSISGRTTIGYGSGTANESEGSNVLITANSNGKKTNGRCDGYEILVWLS